jgi:preprotein translocase subunit SecA
MLLRDAWLVKNNKNDDGFAIPELQPLYEPLEKLNAADLRQRGRDLGVNLNLQSEENLPRVLTLLGLQAEHGERLSAIIQGGVPHSVLNARKHTEESQIIAGAGAFGAVTIATNMAGRGVDIKLGGEVAEEVLSGVARVLRKAGHGEPSNMSLDEQRQAILALKPEDYGIYKAEVEYFIKSVEEMAKVKELGGLHVIGSERHEARRIDNQLRGRAARQGDPGSSRFYLSLQDDLMRLFGGAQVEAAMARMRMDDSVPLEYGLVTRIIEQSQTRVEGANFDARKHLLEYDDVLNTQRATVYAQRDRIMSKDDLTEDVLGMLREEIALRVPAALADDEGPWKLLAWLEQIQPTLVVNRVLVPSFTVELLLDQLREEKITTVEQAKTALLEIARLSLSAEEEHLLGSLEILLENSQARLETQLSEAQETLDTFVQGLRLEEDGQQRNPAQLVTELGGLLHVPLKLSNDEQKLLRNDVDQAVDVVNARVEESLRAQAMLRLTGAVERRLENELGLKPEELAAEDWPQVRERLFAAVNAEFEQRRERLIGANGDGALGKEISESLSKVEGEINQAHLLAALMLMPETRTTTFDKKTHKQVTQRKRRLTFAYHVAQFLEQVKEEEITEKVLKHLENAQKSMQAIWGQAAWANVAQVGLAGLNESGKAALNEELEAELKSLNGQPLSALPAEAQQRGMQSLGKRALTESYRQLLLRVISELWIDYLTRMEALRISIRLEAYAQRDPLVEYKAKAFQMFQELFADMRSSLVNRMFIFQPTTQVRQAAQAGQPAAAANGAANGNQAENSEPAAEASEAKEGGKRRRRRRK